ncbi:MAG: hypothetical protein MK108_01410 [Mariniblastus sp.]|nr:hypothetical protein [Mariniblastus sp.]
MPILSILFPSDESWVGRACLLLFTLALLAEVALADPPCIAAVSFQDEVTTPSQARLLQRIDDLKEELAKQQRVLGSRHPNVRELRAELQVRMKYVDRELDLISTKILPLEIELGKAQLKYAGNHPEIKSLRQQILLWQQYAKQERVGSNQLYLLDTNLEDLRIRLSLLAHLGNRHPDMIDLRQEMGKLQLERNVLGLQEECERQKLHIWKSEVDRLIASRAKQAELSEEQWLTRESRARGMSQEQYRLDVVWQELALEKLAGSDETLRDRKLQGVIDRFRNSQKSNR